MTVVSQVIVTPRGGGSFHVRVVEGDTSTDHDVTISPKDLERLAGERTPDAFVRHCFAFLLEREPKESILRSFDVSAIGRYFPEFDSTIVEA